MVSSRISRDQGKDRTMRWQYCIIMLIRWHLDRTAWKEKSLTARDFSRDSSMGPPLRRGKGQWNSQGDRNQRGGYMSRICHSVVRWWISGSEISEGQPSLGSFIATRLVLSIARRVWVQFCGICQIGSI